jgi:PAT family beta-lactamase induction signal transducer AmpG
MVPFMLKAIFSSNLNLAIFLSGFSSGIPYSLIGSSLQAWLSKEKIGIEHIGAIGLIQLPYAFKFLWAPFLDRYDILPIGKRKGWMIASQLTLMALLGLMSFL